MNTIEAMHTTRDARASRWMSAVTEYVHSLDPSRSKTIRQEWVLSHPMTRAVYDHMMRLEEGGGDAFAFVPEELDRHELEVQFSRAAFEHAKKGGAADEFAPDLLPRKYSNYDWSGWLTCLTVYNEYSKLYPNPIYRSWESPDYGGGDINYGVIEKTLPNDARIAIIGDWGTGMDDAQALVERIIDELNPTILIHVGDIYYSGTPLECDSHVYDLFERVFTRLGRRIPVFTIPGNHDYYAMGAGFYPLIDKLNADPDWKQDASYFCIRTEDRRWQILAMDTGYNDHNPYSFIDEHVSQDVKAPGLRDDEIAWHQEKLANFGGRTILLSHHQLFSANASINGSKTTEPEYLNTDLLEVFEPHFDKIPIWLWGHEHNYALYEDGLMGLDKGRLMGCSGYEAAKREDPYKVNYPEIPYKAEMTRLALYKGYYNHACALIDLSSATLDGPASIRYYQFPSWGQSDTPPANAQLELLNMELFGGELPDFETILGHEYITFHFAPSSTSERSVEVALSPPVDSLTALIVLTGYDANYTEDKQYDFGALAAHVNCAADLKSASATMKLRDNHHDKRVWEGWAKAVVIYSGSPV